MDLKESKYMHSINQHELEKTLQLLNKNTEIFNYIFLKRTHLQERMKQSNKPGETNRVSESLSAMHNSHETLEEWVSNQEIKSRKIKPSRNIVDILENWVTNEVKRDLFKSLDAKYSHTLPQELSTKQMRELGTKLIVLADKLEGKL